ncbi:MAG: TraC family protein [Bdellovibrionota bacterium]
MKSPHLRRFQSFSEYQIEKSLSHELPYWDFLENGVVLADGTLAVGYELRGLAIEALDTNRVNQIATDLRAFINALPDGCEVSFHQEVTCDFSRLLSAHEKLKGTNKNVSWVSDSRLAALKAAATDKNLLRPTLYLFVYKRFEGKKESPLGLLRSFFSAPSQFRKFTKEEHEKSLRELQQVAESIRATFETLGASLTPLSTEDIWEFLYRFLNPNRALTHQSPLLANEHRKQEFHPAEVEKLPAVSIPSPREQVVFSDLIQGYDSFLLDGFHHRLISFKSLPEFTHAAMVARLQQLPFPFSLQVHVKCPEQSMDLSQLQAKRRMAHSMSMSQGGRATDLESEARLHSAEELLREIINTGQKILYFQLTLCLKSSDRDELEMMTKTALSRIRELNGCEGMAETVAGFKVWKTILPMGNTTMVRPRRIKTENLADFLPVYQPFDGYSHPDAKPVCLFRNRFQGLVQYDPFDSRLPNYNALVTGSSGAGKSFLNNLVLLQYITQEPLVFIIDIGGSYRKLCEFLGGQYIEISPPRGSETCKTINPLELPEGSTEPSPQKIKFILSFLENLLTDEDGDKLPKLDKSLLEESVLETYKAARKTKGSDPIMSDLVAVLEKSEDRSLRNYAKMLYPWTGERPYGRLLDAKSTLDLSSGFVVFDLKGLSSYPDLQAAMILIITDFILGRVENTKGKRKQILMDECWELLKSRGSQRFMEYCVRTLRKTGSGITFITQGLEEIVSSPIGSAILSNTATKFVLLQRGDLKPIRELLKLNDQEMSLIASLRQAKGRYSEAFLMSNEARTVVQIHPTPVEYWLATSDAADNQLLEEARATSPEKPLSEHIYDLSKTYPFGATGGKR